MTKDEIHRMARESGLGWVAHKRLERFAALVRAEALDEAAKVCDELRDEDGYEAWNTECAAAIRGLKS